MAAGALPLMTGSQELLIMVIFRTAIILAVMLAGCASSPQPKNVIVADGTEARQFENLVMCGNAQAFMMALGDVGKHLGKAWDDVLGADNQQQCEIRIRVDQSGHILEREVVSCDDADSLTSVLKGADPVPVPSDACLLASINGSSYQLNSSRKDK
jgi:hypothetical protein